MKEEAVLFIVFLFVVVPIGIWVYKNTILETQKSIKIAKYKFDAFKDALAVYNIIEIPRDGSENFITFREKVTNGVETIGIFDYSVHDYIEFSSTEKKHNYYFSINLELKDLELYEKSTEYYKNITTEICQKEIAILRKRITDTSSYKNKIQFLKLKDDII